MSEEDDMVQQIIERDTRRHQDWDGAEVEFEPEAHYNYYGDRGVVDLYAKEIEGDSVWDYLYEVKADSAIEAATGANEILRQFNRMRKFFYEDESRRYPQTYHMELCFVISESTVEHVAKNFNLYRAAQKKMMGPNPQDMDREYVLFRSLNPEATEPAQITSPVSYPDLNTPSDWKEFLFETGYNTAIDEVAEHLEELGY